MRAQSFAERLFSRLQRSGGGEKFEARLAVMGLLSRVIGVHRLLLLNFYPFLQKYLQPHQRDVTQLLAALVQARALRALHTLCPLRTLRLAASCRVAVFTLLHGQYRWACWGRFLSCFGSRDGALLEGFAGWLDLEASHGPTGCSMELLMRRERSGSVIRLCAPV